MNNTSIFKSLMRPISSVLLLLSVILQFVFALLLAFDIEVCGIEEIHSINGFILLGLMLIHVFIYWKSLKSLFRLNKFKI